MKVLYVGLARALWMFDFPSINPGGMNFQPVIEGLTQRYKFSVAPKNPFDTGDAKALTFKSGSFKNSKGVSVLVALQIFNDGFVADTLSSTDDSIEFLEDMIKWLQLEFGLTVPANARKGFLSQIDFEMDASMAKLNPQLPKLIAFLEKWYQPTDGKKRAFDVGGFSCWTEDVNQPPAPGALRIERKIGASFATNHYFSQAPISTGPHKDLLTEFERMLKG